MDPFSIVLGGIAICQVAAKVISLGIAYGQSVSNLPNEVQSLISEIALLAGVMNSLCSALQSEQANEELTISDILLETIKECRQQLEDLYQNLANQGAGNSRLRSLGRALKWPLKEQETKDWIARMERYKNTFSLALQKEGLDVSKKMSGNVELIKTAQEADRAEKKREAQNKTFRSALVWVSPAEPRVNHFANRKLQQSGTGIWFTESRDFELWKSAESSFLWLYGSAGAGKTILSSIILDRLMKEENEAGLGSRTKTIYFYCDFRDSNKVSAAGVYGSLISQLLQAYWKDYLPEEFENFYQDNCQNPPLEVFLKQQLLTLVRTIGRTRIVVDALDECTPSARSDVLETLLEIRKTTSINLLVTSREEVDIKLLVAEAPRLCINAAVNSDDIEHFVIEECERNPNLRRKLKGLTKAEVIATISSKANGMFRWAKCSLDQIGRLRNDKAIKTALTKLPPDLNETYERILDSISAEDKVLALRIFRWLSCSLRPLRVSEILEGIALELGDTILDPDTFLNDPEDIIEICGSLITLDLGIGTISLAHFSVKEFFVSSSGRHPDFVINPVQVNFELAKLCVTYLSFDHFRDGPCASGNELEERFKSYALYSYACSKWPKHAKGHDSMNDDDFLSVVGGFFQDPDLDGNFVAWTQAYHAIPTVHTAYNLGEFWDSYFTHDSEGETNRLVYACRFGIYSLSKLLILSGIDPSAVCTSQKKDEALKTSESNACGNALNAACLSGDIKVVDLILSSGVDINAIAGKHELALIAAIVKCHDRLGPRGPRDYRLLGHLLGKGASVHIMTPRKSWPLYEAGNKGCFEAVKLFLDAGADVSIRHFYLKMTVFEISAIFGRREIFEILRQHGGGKYISPDMQELNLNTSIDGYGLFFASKSNFFESAKKILETDGEKIFKDPSYELLMHHTFLECASNGYYKFLEQMLVYSGNTFSAYVDCCKSAASQGHPKTLGVLLDIKGAKIDDILLGNMMVTAAGRGHQGVVNELMERGVRPFATNEHGWTVMLATALSAAQLQVQDSTLLVLQGTGHGFEKLEHSVLRPSCWKLRPNKDEPFQPNLITKGTSAYLPPGEIGCWITFDHPITPSDPFFYFEVTIEKQGKVKMSIGIVSTLTEYDSSGPSAIVYTGRGNLKSPRRTQRGFPEYQVGSVIGCAVDVKKRVAVFTRDGKLIGASCTNVKGMVSGVAYLTAGDQIKTNFGDEPFVFDTAIFEKGVDGFVSEPTFVFQTQEYVDPLEPVIGAPDTRYIG